MNKLETLLASLEQKRTSVAYAGNPYVSDEYWDRYYDGQCDVLDEIIEEVKSLMKDSNSAS